MTNKVKLYIGILALGAALIGCGVWFALNPILQSPELKEQELIEIEIPDGNPIIFEELNFMMGGETDSLYIYEDGSVLYIEDKGLRMPIMGYPPTRTVNTGTLSTEELNSLLEFFKNNGFTELDEYYNFPGEPITGSLGEGHRTGDGSFTFIISYGELQKQVIAFGYLTPDDKETYPDMPFPLDELYVKLRIIAMKTVEVASGSIPQ